MNRIIKFRAWDEENKKMYFNDVVMTMGIAVIEDPSFDPKSINILETPDLVPMQFTGLFDKNGVEIYEGDILGTSIVKHGFEDENDDDVMEHLSGWYVENVKTGNKHPMNPDWIMGDEIIGNIYENPELLSPNKLKE